MIIARVSDFCVAHARMGEKLEDALKYYDACDKKIRARGQSIVGAADKLISYGIPQNTKKPLQRKRPRNISTITNIKNQQIVQSRCIFAEVMI